MKKTAFLFVLLVSIGCSSQGHLRNIRQLTFDGTHAEAYWSPDGEKLVLQAIRPGDKADQVYVMDPDTGEIERKSSGEGKCTCSYFLPDGRLVWSTTKFSGAEPPPPPDRSKGYRWPLYREFEIILYDKGEITRLTNSDGYDAESTLSPDGKRIVFMSQRDGEFAIYTMKTDGSDLQKVTRRRCYTGGPFYSPDGEWLVYRAMYPANERDEKELDMMIRERALVPYKGMVIEIYVAKADGSQERAITDLGKISFAPHYHPNGDRVIFTSDARAEGHGVYHLYIVSTDGTDLEQISFRDGFDGFPHFSPDGKHLVWISDRNAKKRGELNVFVAEWHD